MSVSAPGSDESIIMVATVKKTLNFQGFQGFLDYFIYFFEGKQEYSGEFQGVGGQCRNKTKLHHVTSN